MVARPVWAGRFFLQNPTIMKRARYNRIWGGIDEMKNFDAMNDSGSDAYAESDSDAGASSGLWQSIVNNAGGWLNSIGQSVSSSIAAKNQPTVVDNTPRVLAIAGVGVAAVVLIIALLIIFKK